MKNKKIATVFGGGMKDTETIEYKESILIGNLLAKHKYLVKNGGYHGIMEAVSKGAYEKGGIVAGYTCKTFPSTKGNAFLTNNMQCENIYDRLKSLIENTDLFIVQKGGIGTLSEISLVLDIVRKRKNPPKIYVMGETWKNVFIALSLIMNTKEQTLITFCNAYQDLEKEFSKQ